MSDRSELPEVLEHVRDELRAAARSHARIGLRVTGIEADSDNGKPFPDLVIYVEHEDVDGERVGRFNLEHNGHLMEPGDAGVSLRFGILETTAQQIARLPRSGRDADGI
jgi:hypothetical protein